MSISLVSSDTDLSWTHLASRKWQVVSSGIQVSVHESQKIDQKPGSFVKGTSLRNGFPPEKRGSPPPLIP